LGLLVPLIGAQSRLFGLLDGDFLLY
jgi:hypothetical protein